VLNCGLHKWTMEGRPISTEPCRYPPAHFTARLRPELMADKRDVLAAIGDSGTCLINALTAEEHAGTIAYYGRPGRIPASVNVPTVALVPWWIRSRTRTSQRSSCALSSRRLARSTVVG